MIVDVFNTPSVSQNSPTLFAIRHAPPEDTTVYCHDDTPICATAADYLESAILFLKSHPQTPIFVSPQPRAQQTAQLLIASSGLDIEYTTDDRLGAKGYGKFQGQKKTSKATLYEKFYNRPLGGENYHDVSLRTRDFLVARSKEILQKEAILMVTHDSTVKTFVAMCKGDPEIFLASFSYGALTDVSEACNDADKRVKHLVDVVSAMHPGFQLSIPENE